MTEIRNPRGNLIGFEDIDIYASFMSDGRKMKHRVCRASKCHVHGKRIIESFLGKYLARSDVILKEFHHLIPRFLCKPDTL